jgi:S1-C subfamily serine protease
MKRVILIALVIGGGMVGGAVSGWLVSSVVIGPELNRLSDRLDQGVATATSTAPVIQIVPIEPRSGSGDGLEILKRRSPVFSIVRKATAKDDRVITEDRVIGSAVSLTSDGWFVTPQDLFKPHRVADLALMVDGTTVPIEQAVRDTTTGAVFFKVASSGLPAAAFVRAGDVLEGASVWVESRARRVMPESVADIRIRAVSDPVSSEKTSRRFLVTSAASQAIIGSAVWDGRGQLVGLVEAKAIEGLRVLPAHDLAGALAALLNNGKITHASLGVFATDLGAQALDDRGTLPRQGAWLRADRLGGHAAVAVNGPSAGRLKEQDVILRIERDILDGTADIGERLLDYRPGAEVALTIQRDGKEMEVLVKLGEAVTHELVK